MIVDLDSPASRDPVRVGAKAAALAAARGIGAPVLPGLVVAGSASSHHMKLGAETLASRGSGGARLVVSDQPLEFADELCRRGERLGDRLVARSSSLLEASGEWSGAFTSYLDIAPPDLPKAVAGCWASAFSVAALERQAAAGVVPGSFPMSVLIQPAIAPETAGWATLGEDGRVTVHGVKGHPGPLLSGWETGHEARFDRAWTGDELIDTLGMENLESIRQLLGRLRAHMGADRCEWALTDRLWALQVGKGPAADTIGGLWGGTDVPAELLGLVTTLIRAPGPLGEQLVIPWAFGGIPDSRAFDPKVDGSALDEAMHLSRSLVEQVWRLPHAEATTTMRRALNSLAGGDPGEATAMIRGLVAPDPHQAASLLGILRSLRTHLAERGVVPDPEAAWYLDPGSLRAALLGRKITPPQRLGVGRWEPLVASVVLGTGRAVTGVPSSPGIGAGRRIEIADPHSAGPAARSVLTAAHPVPNLASLLWDSAGLVTRSGSPAAHLFEAARALRVPAVSGVDLGEAHGEVVAIDGHAGIVSTLEIESET